MIDVEPKEQLIQNSLTSNAPAFCTTPHWYMSGCEKKVKIGKMSFNYIDYLEAWCNFDCNTYRSELALRIIRDKIEEAFKSVEEELRKQSYTKKAV